LSKEEIGADVLTRPVKRKGGQGLSERARTSVKIELFDARGRQAGSRLIKRVRAGEKRNKLIHSVETGWPEKKEKKGEADRWISLVARVK
jgi:hypothetical protein